jgi:hypothetical protein
MTKPLSKFLPVPSEIHLPPFVTHRENCLFGFPFGTPHQPCAGYLRRLFRHPPLFSFFITLSLLILS